MKKILIIFGLASVVASAQQPELTVDDLVSQGQMQLQLNSKKCKNAKYPHQLGQFPSQFQSPCVLPVQLPLAVEVEIGTMRANELENESDYDQRVTRLEIFEHKHYNPAWSMDLEGIKTLAKNFNIKRVNTEDGYKNPGLSVSALLVTPKSFQHHGGDLMLGDGYDFDQTEALFPNYLGNLLNGQLAIHFQFGEFLGLYPGGGFGVVHHFYITQTHLVYLKHSGWDA